MTDNCHKSHTSKFQTVKKIPMHQPFDSTPMTLNFAWRDLLFKNQQQNILFFSLCVFLLCVRELYRLCGVIVVTCKWCMKRKLPVLSMHRENTGSSLQAWACCLFILNSNSSSKDPEWKDNSHPSNYLYCYFKGDTFQESLSLPLYLPQASIRF